MVSIKNFGEYREVLYVQQFFCIFFFGVYLIDLIFIEDGILFIIKKINFINFVK